MPTGRDTQTGEREKPFDEHNEDRSQTPNKRQVDKKIQTGEMLM